MDEPRTANPGPADASTSVRLAVVVSEARHVLRGRADSVTIGRKPPCQIVLSEPGISGIHARIEYQDGDWTITDTGSKNGTFLDGERVEHVVVDHAVTVHLGNPNGVALQLDPYPEDATAPEEIGDAALPGHAPADGQWTRVGAAVRERREELGLSARTLADQVMTPEDYAMLEDGQLWPDPEAQALLERRLLWPAGVLADLRDGGDIPDDDSTDLLSPTVQVAVAVDAAAIEVRTIRAKIGQLPDPGDRRFVRDVTQLLTQLRLLDRLATAAARQAPGRLEVAAAVAAVRQTRGALLVRATASPWVTLGQRLGAMRFRAHFTVAEVATAAGVSSADVEAVERDDQVSAPVRDAVEAFLTAMGDAV